jgi:hypothetical protein
MYTGQHMPLSLASPTWRSKVLVVSVVSVVSGVSVGKGAEDAEEEDGVLVKAGRSSFDSDSDVPGILTRVG